MPTVTIRLDDDTREKLDELASTKGVTISVLLRDQIDELLGADVQKMRRTDVPHSLSMQQRLLLAQQHDILLALLARDDADADEGEYHRNMAEVLREGYAGEYDRAFASILPEVTRTECSMLWDILDMFRVVGASLDALPAADRESLGEDNERLLRFSGLDLNDSLESRLLYYVRYLIKTDRWSELNQRLEEVGDNGNSHSPRLAMYQRMLAVYKPLWDARFDGRGLSPENLRFGVDELRQVADAHRWAPPPPKFSRNW